MNKARRRSSGRRCSDSKTDPPQRRQLQQKSTLPLLAYLCNIRNHHPHHLQLQCPFPHIAPYAFIFKTNESELSGTKYKECNNPSEFDNGLLTCQHFSQSNPRVGLIMRNLSPMNQFAQINLLFIPRNTSATTLSTLLPI